MSDHVQVVVDDESHHRHATALAHQLIEEVDSAAKDLGLDDAVRRRELVGAVMFRVCAVLDGSAHAGLLDGQAIAPFVGFYYEHDTERPLVPSDGSAMHEVIDDLVNEYFAPKR